MYGTFNDPSAKALNKPDYPESLSTSSEEDLLKTNCDHRIPPIDPAIISELEEQAKAGSKSVEKMMSYLGNELTKVTKVTEETVNTYDVAVQHVHSEVETNIHSMYALIAKCEELDRKMEPVTDLAKQVRSINEVLDNLEQLCK